jgi:hypothetical protein
MDNRFAGRAALIVFLFVAAAAGIGFMAYNAGVAHGLAEGGRWAATPGAAVPYVYPWRPWGFGFGFFPFFLFVLCFFLLRRVLWGGRGWGHYYDGVPPRFEEWHRRAHERESESPSRSGA